MNALTLSEKEIYSGKLILINRGNPLRNAAREPELREIGNGVQLEKTCAVALDRALKAVSAEDKIVPVSGWRSMEEQEKIFSDCLSSDGEEFTRKFVALPGCSEHQTGLAVDLGENRPEIDFIRPDFPYEGICESFRQIAPEFGFVERYPKGAERITEIGWEPWHFRYVGFPHAMIMYSLGLTLEEYHDFVRKYPYGQQPYVFVGGGQEIEISYLPAADSGRAYLAEDSSRVRTISGNNMDGFVIAAWR